MRKEGDALASSTRAYLQAGSASRAAEPAGAGTAPAHAVGTARCGNAPVTCAKAPANLKRLLLPLVRGLPLGTVTK